MEYLPRPLWLRILAYRLVPPSGGPSALYAMLGIGELLGKPKINRVERVSLPADCH
jgi:hypothetical protein